MNKRKFFKMSTSLIGRFFANPVARNGDKGFIVRTRVRSVLFEIFCRNIFVTSYFHLLEVQSVIKGLPLTEATYINFDNCKATFNIVASGKVSAEKFISHVMPLSEFVEGAKLALEGKARKVVFVP